MATANLESPILECIEVDRVLPPAPHLMAQLIKITEDPNYSHADVVRVLSADAGVAGAILRMANSAFFGSPRKVASVSEAVVRMGVRQVRAIVLSHAMIGVVGARNSPIDLSYFWRRSLTAAVLTSRLAREMKDISSDVAFTVGLLADIGVPILCQAMPRRYAAVAEHYAPRSAENFHAREREALGFTHADVSAVVLDRWSLPDEIVRGIQYHHSENSPPDLSPATARLTRLLCGADEISRLLCEAPDANTVDAACSRAMQTMNLPAAVLHGALTIVEKDIGDLARALGVEIVASRVYETIAAWFASRLEGAAR